MKLAPFTFQRARGEQAMTLVFDNENYGKHSFSFVVATQTTEDEWRSGKKELPLM